MLGLRISTFRQPLDKRVIYRLQSHDGPCPHEHPRIDRLPPHKPLWQPVRALTRRDSVRGGYTKCTDGQDQTARRRIEDALREPDTSVAAVRQVGRTAATERPPRTTARTVGPWHGSADPGRGGKYLAAARGPAAQAGHQGPGCRRDANTHGPPAIAVRPVRRCFPGRGDGPRRAVGPAQPAAADGARDRRRSPGRRVLGPAGGPGRAAAQAEDRRRLSPGRSRIGSPAAGSIG